MENHERYREEFDYYSIGILMLEIGHWETLSKMTANSRRFRGLTQTQFREALLRHRVPQLAINMGTRYMQATQKCLDGGFTDRQDGDSWHNSFKNLVMNQVTLMD